MTSAEHAAAPDPPAGRRRLPRPATLAGVTLAGALAVGTVAACGGAIAHGAGDWRAVRATVRSGVLERPPNGGSAPVWVLLVDADYTFGGVVRRTNRLQVFRHLEHPPAVAERALWPPGRTFRLYVDAARPHRVRLSPGGSAAAAKVVAVLGIVCTWAVAAPFLWVSLVRPRLRRPPA